VIFVFSIKARAKSPPWGAPSFAYFAKGGKAGTSWWSYGVLFCLFFPQKVGRFILRLFSGERNFCLKLAPPQMVEENIDPAPKNCITTTLSS
jgi:hypothetical protein